MAVVHEPVRERCRTDAPLLGLVNVEVDVTSRLPSVGPQRRLQRQEPVRDLVFEARDGWEPLCDFLGKPVPSDPYPRSNSRQEFFELLASGGES